MSGNGLLLGDLWQTGLVTKRPGAAEPQPTGRHFTTDGSDDHGWKTTRPVILIPQWREKNSFRNFQAIGHGRRLFPQTLLGVFENNPSARGFIVYFLRQSLLEAGIGFALQRHQMRRKMTAFGGREALGLLLQFGKTHAGTIPGWRPPSTGETGPRATVNPCFIQDPVRAMRFQILECMRTSGEKGPMLRA